MGSLREAARDRDWRGGNASEQDRPDVAAEGAAWKASQPEIDIHRLALFDETRASTKMARLYGRSPHGQRCVAALPHRHWKTTIRRRARLDRYDCAEPVLRITLRLERTPHSILSLQEWERQMSKRKSSTAPKHARSPKIAATAQRATHAIVRSRKDSRLRSAEEGMNESPRKRPEDSQQEAPVAEKLVKASQDDFKQTMTDSDTKKGPNFFSATANVRAYQAKLLEMAQANMQFAFEFAQRLATVRSPFEFPSVIAEFTSKRMAMFRRYSKEMAELTTKRWTP